LIKIKIKRRKAPQSENLQPMLNNETEINSKTDTSSLHCDQETPACDNVVMNAQTQARAVSDNILEVESSEDSTNLLHRRASVISVGNSDISVGMSEVSV